MKNFGIEKFKEFLKNSIWERRESLEVLSEAPIIKQIHNKKTGRSQFAKTPFIEGIGSAELTCGDCSLFYSEVFKFEKYEFSTFHSSAEGVEESFIYEGFDVVNEDGESIGEDEIFNLVDDILGISGIEYSALEDEKKITQAGKRKAVLRAMI